MSTPIGAHRVAGVKKESEVNMVLPKQVQAEADAAAVLQQQLYGVPASDDAHTEPEAVAPEVPSVEQAEPVVVETPQAPVDTTDWKHRYDTLQGKFNAEVPGLYRKLHERDSELQSLQARLVALEQQASKPEDKPSKLVTDADVETFGGDMVDMVQRAAREEVKAAVAAALSEMRGEFNQVTSRVQEVSTRQALSEEDKFWSAVRGQVGDWDTLDSDPRWIEWLNTTPEFTTETYRQLAGRAINAGDATRVINLVKIFRGVANQAPRPFSETPELTRQVTPQIARGAAPTAPTEKIWSRADYEAAYDPRNARTMTAAKLEALQAEADRAVAEGRIRF